MGYKINTKKNVHLKGHLGKLGDHLLYKLGGPGKPCRVFLIITLYRVFLIISIFNSSKSCSEIQSIKYGAEKRYRKQCERVTSMRFKFAYASD